MKKIRDRFSGHSDIYQKYRPRYPEALYRLLLKYTPGRKYCWDCGTGNGQVALELAAHFEMVYATDISKNQLDQAPKRDNICYCVQRAEKTNFEAGQFDLITVAQAVHWFDIPAFFKEAARVARPGGVLALWGYGLLYFGVAPIDAAIHSFYSEVVGPYWDGERRHIDSAYETIPFDLKHVERLQGLSIERPMDLTSLQGYLTSWSSVQNYIQSKGINPVTSLIDALSGYWKDDHAHMARFPIFGKLGKVLP